MKFHDVIRELVRRTVDPETAAEMHAAIDEHEAAPDTMGRHATPAPLAAPVPAVPAAGGSDAKP